MAASISFFIPPTLALHIRNALCSSNERRHRARCRRSPHGHCHWPIARAAQHCPLSSAIMPASPARPRQRHARAPDCHDAELVCTVRVGRAPPYSARDAAASPHHLCCNWFDARAHSVACTECARGASQCMGWPLGDREHRGGHPRKSVGDADGTNAMLHRAWRASTARARPAR